MPEKKRFYWFDLIRGLSAIAVCGGHLRAALFVDFNQLESSTQLQKVFYFVTGLGHQAVIVFFVLSGFFVGGSVLKKQNNFAWLDYITARLTRLWVVLIPALVFTRIIDLCIQIIDPSTLSGAYETFWGSGPQAGGSYSNSFYTFLGNLAFLQNIVVPTYGTNGSLWSLANEFWYYIIFPLLIAAIGYFKNQKSLLNRAIATAITLIVFFWLPSEFMLGFLIWTLGAAIWWLHSRQFLKSFWLFTVVGVAVFLSSLIYSKSSSIQSLLKIDSDIVVGIGAFLLISSLTNLSFLKTPKNSLQKFSLAISEFSYSLYLFHLPVVFLIALSFYGSHQLQPNTTGLIQYFGWLSLLLLGGSIFWWLFEKRTKEFRRGINIILKLS